MARRLCHVVRGSAPLARRNLIRGVAVVHCHGAALPDSVPVAHWHGVLGMGTWQYGTGMVQLDVWCGSAALPRAVTSCHVPPWHCHKIDRAIAALELNTPRRSSCNFLLNII